MNKRVTIKDIAEKSGVSTGTVDRVIHSRGNVAAEVRVAVLKVMDELGFQRNLMASALAYNRIFRIVALLPNPKQDSYWEQPYVGVQKAYSAIQHYGIQVDIIEFDLFSPKDFKAKAKDILNNPPNGILFPPIFEKEGIYLLNEAKKKNISCVLFNTFLSHDDALSYIGQYSFQSGVLAGRLLDFSLKKDDVVLILNLDKETNDARHLLDKQKGCIHYFEQNAQKGIQVINYDFEDFDNPEALNVFFNDILTQYPKVSGVFITNSRAYKLVNCLDNTLLETLTIVGFDLLPQNIEYLNKRYINFLINQNSTEQGMLSVYSLFKTLFKKEGIDRLQYLPLDIVVPENMEYYLEKQTNLALLV